MRKFHLHRNKDISGISGTGDVAEGVQFKDGQVVLSWMGQFHCMSIWPTLDAMLHIHGHEGATIVEWEEP